MTIHRINRLASIPSLPGYIPPEPPRAQTVATPRRLELSEHESMTDYGNAQRFIHQHGDKLYYSHAQGHWLMWNGKTWCPDTNNQVETFAQNTAKNIIEEVAHVQDVKYKASLEKWASASMNHARYVKMLKAAMPKLSVKLEDFDNNKWLLNVLNGTLNLETGELKQHDRADMITKICNVNYEPDAKCELWRSFLDRIFESNNELIRFVQKVVGYCLTGEVSEKCFFILLGEHGDNGKTVFVNVLIWLFEDYATQTPIDTLIQRKPGAQSNDIVALRGARIIAAAEANKSHHFDHALVKRLTGNDPVTARQLYKEFITFKPEGKILIATNRTPRFDINDKAFDNRIRMIPFNVVIPPDEQDRQLEDKLKAEAEGILAWAIEGCSLWQHEGLGQVPVVGSGIEVRPYSSVKHFIETCCCPAPGNQIYVAELYPEYLIYHSDMDDGTEPLAINVFGAELSGLDIAADHNRTGNFRIGIALRKTELVDMLDSPTILA